MRAPFDDDDYVIDNSGDSVNISTGDTSFDLMTCAIGQLSDDEIAAMEAQDLIDLLSLSSWKLPFPNLRENDLVDFSALQSIVKSERDRCRAGSAQR